MLSRSAWHIERGHRQDALEGVGGYPPPGRPAYAQPLSSNATELPPKVRTVRPSPPKTGLTLTLKDCALPMSMAGVRQSSDP